MMDVKNLGQNFNKQFWDILYHVINIKNVILGPHGLIQANNQDTLRPRGLSFLCQENNMTTGQDFLDIG